SEARSRAPRMCNKVLLPAPDSPTIASISPLPTANDKFSKSTRSESPERKTFFSLSTRNIGPCAFRCNWLPLRYREQLQPACRHQFFRGRILDASGLPDVIRTWGP